MKDHEIKALVNDLRDIAVKYHSSGQLRERIAHVIVPVLKPPSTLAQQVAEAQAEVAKWPEGKLAAVKLAGGDQP